MGGVAVRKDDLGEEALGLGGNFVEIKLDQRRPRLDAVTDLYSWSEADPFKVDGVDPDVHQHFHPASRPQCQRMECWMKLDDFAGARGDENGISWINRKAVADQLLGKDRIGNAFQRVNHSGEWCVEKERVVRHKQLPPGFGLDAVR